VPPARGAEDVTEPFGLCPGCIAPDALRELIDHFPQPRRSASGTSESVIAMTVASAAIVSPVLIAITF
jgi:hypothetical protein